MSKITKSSGSARGLGLDSRGSIPGVPKFAFSSKNVYQEKWLPTYGKVAKRNTEDHDSFQVELKAQQKLIDIC